MADGRAGLMQFPFWMWTHSAGVGQEYVDHYYWAIATAGNKLFADFCEQPEDRMAGWSIIEKTVNDLAGAYHPNLKKLMGPASRTYYQHVLGQQDGLYHILHMISKHGALCDTDTGALPGLTMAKDAKGNTPRPLSAWGHDITPSQVALESMSGPWAAPWFTEIVDEKPLPWSLLAEKKVVSDGDWVSTYFGENYGLSSIRLTPQRIHVLGHWRRQAVLPESMRDIGTLDLRMGYNQTRIANDGSGVISQQGQYRCYQHGNRLIMLARPHVDFLNGKQKEIKSLQCTAALFNYQLPAPTWEIYVDEAKIDALPAVARFGQVITVRDGVSYLAIRPLPTTDLGRDTEITLEPGVPQEPAHHGNVNIQPALLINAYLYNRNDVITPELLQQAKAAQAGFVVEMGDEKEYGSFEKFQAHVARRQADGRRQRRGDLHDRQGHAGGKLGQLHGQRPGPVRLRQRAAVVAGHHAHPDGPGPPGKERRGDRARAVVGQYVPPDLPEAEDLRGDEPVAELPGVLLPRAGRSSDPGRRRVFDGPLGGEGFEGDRHQVPRFRRRVRAQGKRPRAGQSPVHHRRQRQASGNVERKAGRAQTVERRLAGRLDRRISQGRRDRGAVGERAVTFVPIGFCVGRVSRPDSQEFRDLRCFPARGEPKDEPTENMGMCAGDNGCDGGHDLGRFPDRGDLGGQSFAGRAGPGRDLQRPHGAAAPGQGAGVGHDRARRHRHGDLHEANQDRHRQRPGQVDGPARRNGGGKRAAGDDGQGCQGDAGLQGSLSSMIH